jgi:hypothetical protein
MTRDENQDTSAVPSDADRPDAGLEAAARRQFVRLGEAIDVGPQPIRLTDRAARRRATVPLRVATAVGLAAAVVAVAAVWSSGPPSADVTVGQAAEGDSCEPRLADDGVIGSGTSPDGDEWMFRVGWEHGQLVGLRYVDGEGQGGWGHDAASWPSVVNGGVLTGSLSPMEGGWVLDLPVPVAAASVDVDLADGTTVQLCPATVARPAPDAGPDPTGIVAFAAGFVSDAALIDSIHVHDARGRRLARIEGVAEQVLQQQVDNRLSAQHRAESFDLPLPEDPSGVTLDVDLDPALVPLPLGGRVVPDYVDPMATAIEVIGGELAGGRWSLRAGTNGDEIGIRLDGPGVTGGGGGTPGQLNDLGEINWTVWAADGGLLVSGLAPPEVTTVVVTLGDEGAVPTPTVDAGVAGLDLPMFAVALPESASASDIESIEGLDAAGTVRYRADIAASDRFDDLHAGDGGLDGVGLAIEPVG